MDKPILFTRRNDRNSRQIVVQTPTTDFAMLFGALPLFDSPVFQQPVIKLFDGATELMEFAHVKLETLNDNGWRNIALEAVKNTLSAPFKALIKVANDRMTELEKKKATWLDYLKTDPAADAELRGIIRNMKGAELVKYVLSSPEIQVAALRNWSVTGLAPEMRKRVEEELLMSNLVSLYASQTQIKPTWDNPLAHGPDFNHAREMARGAVKKLADDWDEIENVKATINSAMTFAAAVTNLGAQDTFELLYG